MSREIIQMTRETIIRKPKPQQGLQQQDLIRPAAPENIKTCAANANNSQIAINKANKENNKSASNIINSKDFRQQP